MYEFFSPFQSIHGFFFEIVCVLMRYDSRANPPAHQVSIPNPPSAAPLPTMTGTARPAPHAVLPTVPATISSIWGVIAVQPITLLLLRQHPTLTIPRRMTVRTRTIVRITARVRLGREAGRQRGARWPQRHLPGKLRDLGREGWGM